MFWDLGAWAHGRGADHALWPPTCRSPRASSTSTALETPGAVIGPEEVAEALGWGEDVISLGEVMNFPGVVFGDEKMHGEISAALRAEGGRQPSPWPPTTSDSPPTPRAALPAATRAPPPRTQRLRQGMYAKLRRGSAWHDVEATIKAHTEMGLDPHRILLVTTTAAPSPSSRRGT